MNNDPAFEQALDEALHWLASGVSREECLRRLPRYAADLAPLLAAAEAARAGLLAGQPLPAPNLARGKRRFLEAARGSNSRPLWVLNVRWMRAALAAWVVSLVVLMGAGAASANALPGDVLYPVKRGLESIQLTLTFDPEARARVQTAQAERRRAEAQRVLELRRVTRLEFEGVVERVEPEALWISGLRVLTDKASEFQIADAVRVWAHTSAEALFADQIILLARPTSTPPSTNAPTLTATLPRPLGTNTSTPTFTFTLTPTRQPPTITRVAPTVSATLTVMRPTLQPPTHTLTPFPTQARPTATPTPVRLDDTPTPEPTATLFRLTPTVTPTGRP